MKKQYFFRGEKLVGVKMKSRILIGVIVLSLFSASQQQHINISNEEFIDLAPHEIQRFVLLSHCHLI